MSEKDGIKKMWINAAIINIFSVAIILVSSLVALNKITAVQAIEIRELQENQKKFIPRPELDLHHSWMMQDIEHNRRDIIDLQKEIKD